jgi:alanine racemase
MTGSRWAWVEVDLSAIAHNVAALKGLTAPGTLFMAVVKADGYGHGADEVARAALGSGADRLGVATVPEAVALRDAGISAPIQLLSEPPASAVEVIIEHSLIPTITTKEFAGALARASSARGVETPFHLKVDTGMNRIGVRADEAVQFAAMVAQFPGLALEGVFTHFATADVAGDWDATRQLQRFTEVVSAMREAKVDPGIVHASNSPATILLPEAHFDMVRCGIALYGLHPSRDTYERVDLRPAMSVKARTTLVKRIGMGEGVSYGLTWQAPVSTDIATLPLGYADGVHRNLSNVMKVLCGGVRMSQVGRVCMDQMMVEVPGSSTVEIGDEFVIVGQQQSSRILMDELADLAGTINYELACSFGMRLERIYL